MREDEVSWMSRAAETVRELLSPEHQAVLDARGPLEGPLGDRTTVCVDGAACVFVMYDNGVAVCSIERLYLAGRFPWRKPVSCHLYPIRIDDGVPERVRYEEVEICRPGRERGEREGIRLTDFVKDALERIYGPAWASAARTAAVERSDRI